MVFLRLGILLVLYLILAWVSLLEEDLDRILGEAEVEVRDVAGQIEGGTVGEKVPDESLPQPMMKDVPGPSGESQAQAQAQEKNVEVGEKAPIVG
ncbi:UNVERIFIED_CONTAM: hypothetical protein Slati_2921200 [Sesamum latifolium]|uniref:Uncharacterized protein n=1 Tax=Sesamum latifolium TaxID=2727402 RepID=A0AAW2VCK5_9LAMI